MDVKTLIEGLKNNYPVGVHPTEIAEKDFLRTLRNMGFAPDQLDKLYDELLASCSFFPKVFDIHSAVFKLGLVRPEQDAVQRTANMLEGYQDHVGKELTFREWLGRGGYETICRECSNDQEKIQRRLAAMGIIQRPDDTVKAKNHKSDLTPALELPPEFPCAETSSDVVVEYEDEFNGLDEL